MNPPSLSICIPIFDKAPSVIQRALDSVLDDRPQSAEVLLAPQGPGAARLVDLLEFPEEVRVLDSDVPGGLVGNWNRCLREAGGELIHLLHDDDAVATGFYATIQALAELKPAAGLYVTGWQRLTEVPGPPLPQAVPTSSPEGFDAASLLLRGTLHCCGSVVIPRRSVQEAGLFSPKFPYCPDEEAYPRYALRGGLAVDPRPLYLERHSAAQARRATWHRADFAEVYLGARIEGAHLYGREAVEIALEVGVSRVFEVAMIVARQGNLTTARLHVAAASRLHPATASSSRNRLRRLALTLPFLLPLVRLRRRLKEAARRRRTRSGPVL
jgi:hypothetical protein